MKLSQRLNLSGRHRLPVVLQAENAECGLACVTMIANAFGRAESLTSLRQICGIGQRGATLQSIIDTCATLGLNTRAVRCELDALASIQTPAILHWNFDHFVVLKRASRKSITVHDPAVGVRTYGLAEAGNHFTGIALEVNAGRDFIQREPVERVQLSHFFTGVRSLVPAILQILHRTAVARGDQHLWPEIGERHGFHVGLGIRGNAVPSKREITRGENAALAILDFHVRHIG